MDTLQHLMAGFGVALTPMNLMVAAIGAFIGTIVGMLPGLGPINGVAILMPLAFALKLPPETALILLAAVYIGCEYGGRISSILLNVPGDAGAIMTALDGHPMAKKGLGGVALSISAWSSFVGSMVATLGIVLFAPLLARWALAFGPDEYFALMCFAFACIAGLMGDAPMKAALAAIIGLSLSTIGLDSNSGVYRFTGDNVHLSDGIQFIVVVIGVFSVSEVLLMLEQHHSNAGLIRVTVRTLFNLQEMAHTGCGAAQVERVGGHRVAAGLDRQAPPADCLGHHLQTHQVGGRGAAHRPAQRCTHRGQPSLGLGHGRTAHHQAVVAQHQHVHLALGGQRGHRQGQRQARAHVVHPAPAEGGQRGAQGVGGIRQHGPGDGVHRVHVQHHRVGHQRVQRGLDRRPQARRGELRDQRGAHRVRLAGGDTLAHLGQAHRREQRALQRVAQPQAGGLDPDCVVHLHRGVAARGLDQQRVGAQAGRGLGQAVEGGIGNGVGVHAGLV